jgi:hypothetical protein
MIVIKEGRVLSGKNRTLIKDCIDALSKLMEATEIVPKGIEGKKEIEAFIEIDEEEISDDNFLDMFSKADIEEITKKAIASISPKINIDYNKILDNVVSKMKGKVL